MQAYDAAEIARQITLKDFEYFSAISLLEFPSYLWKSSEVTVRIVYIHL